MLGHEEKTPRTILSTLHVSMCKMAHQLWYKKSKDYGSSDDPYYNFHWDGSRSILSRMADKLYRLKSFEEKGHFCVSDESVLDTCLDIINYAVLYLGYRTLHKKEHTELVVDGGQLKIDFESTKNKTTIAVSE